MSWNNKFKGNKYLDFTAQQEYKNQRYEILKKSDNTRESMMNELFN